MDRKTKGKIGEAMAETFLKKKGIEILEKNYRYGRGEIDLIGLKDNRLLIFVEVKYRKNDQFGQPESFVSTSQQQLIMATAEEYIHGINWQKDIRFDIVAIDESTGELTHLEDAFY
jgi:putative endonuclease